MEAKIARRDREVQTQPRNSKHLQVPLYLALRSPLLFTFAFCRGAFVTIVKAGRSKNIYSINLHLVHVLLIWTTGILLSLELVPVIQIIPVGNNVFQYLPPGRRRPLKMFGFFRAGLIGHSTSFPSCARPCVIYTPKQRGRPIARRAST